MPAIDFYYDVVCPYAYLASTRVEAVARRCGATVRWRPILLGGLLRTVGAPDDPNEAMNPTKRALLGRDRARWAAMYGVPLREPLEHPRRTVSAMRLCLAAPPGPVRVAVSRDLFEAYWVRGDDVTDPEVLGLVATRHGLAADAFAEPAVREGLFSATAEAAQAGAFGVPSFAVDGTLWWGQDRLPLVERALGGEPPPLYEAPAQAEVAPSDVRLRLYHDFASPFSYLAATQIERIAAARGVTVQWVPILLGALFRELGTPNVPLLEMNPAKQAYVRRDLDDWAGYWGVPFRFPQRFPMRSVLPLRVALVDPTATGTIYAAAWAQDRIVDEPEALAAVLTDAGLDASIIEQTQQAGIKAQLRDNTELARSRGVCGVPTFEVERGGESAIVWGQDRLDQVAAILDGWNSNVA